MVAARRRCRAGHDGRRSRRLVARAWWKRQAPDCPPVPLDSEHMLYLLYTSGTTAKPKGIMHTTGRLPAGRQLHARDGLRHQGRRRLLVRGRHRLGHRPLLHRLRAAGQRHHRRALRGLARHAQLGALVGDHRGVQRHHALHGADRDPRLHEAGRGAAGQARPLLAAPARQRRRAHQSRGLDLVPRAHRRRHGARSWTPGGRPRPARS